MEHAKLLNRVAAYLLDCIILGLILGAINLVLGGGVFLVLGGLKNIQSSMLVIMVVLAFIGLMNLAIIFGYFVYFESSQRMATLGKSFMKLKVVDNEGNRLTLAKAAIRNAVKFLPGIGGLLLLVSLLMIAFTQDKKAIHDIAAGTQVVSEE